MFDELTKLGRGLGAHGFTTISAIDADDGSGRYYFECDMRPKRLGGFFALLRGGPGTENSPMVQRTEVLTKASATATADNSSEEMTIPYFLRMRSLDLLRNRFGAWRFIPRADARLLRRLLLGEGGFYAGGAGKAPGSAPNEGQAAAHAHRRRISAALTHRGYAAHT